MSFTLMCMDGEVVMPIDYMDDLGFVKDAADDEDNPVIQAPDITKEVAEQVKTFCEHHKVEPVHQIKAPLRHADLGGKTEDGKSANNVPAWAATWVASLGLTQRFELLNGADFLQCDPLLELCAASIASYCKSLPKETFEATFKPSQDFTPEQERLLLQENNWPEDDL